MHIRLHIGPQFTPVKVAQWRILPKIVHVSRILSAVPRDHFISSADFGQVSAY